MSLRFLLMFSGGVEAFGGILTLIAPAIVTEVLLGGPPDTIAIVLARFFGAGMFALGLACLRARDYAASPAGLTIVYSIAAYNALAAVLIVWAGSIGLGSLILKVAGLGHAVIGVLLARGILSFAREQSKVGAKHT